MTEENTSFWMYNVTCITKFFYLIGNCRCLKYFQTISVIELFQRLLRPRGMGQYLSRSKWDFTRKDHLILPKVVSLPVHTGVNVGRTLSRSAVGMCSTVLGLRITWTTWFTKFWHIVSRRWGERDCKEGPVDLRLSNKEICGVKDTV